MIGSLCEKNTSLQAPYSEVDVHLVRFSPPELPYLYMTLYKAKSAELLVVGRHCSFIRSQVLHSTIQSEVGS